MTVLVRDKGESRDLIRQRKALGLDRYDEVWDGVYVMPPMANNEHQQVVGRVTAIMQDVIGWPGLGEVRAGVNVSDRKKNWQKNYRIPDVAVFLEGGKAVNLDTHWLGGPDWLTEVLSPGEEAYEKFDFYAKVGVREILLIDRDPWGIKDCIGWRIGNCCSIGKSTLEQPDELKSSVLPLSFRLVAGLDAASRGSHRIERHAAMARVGISSLALALNENLRFSAWRPRPTIRNLHTTRCVVCSKRMS